MVTPKLDPALGLALKTRVRTEVFARHFDSHRFDGACSRRRKESLAKVTVTRDDRMIHRDEIAQGFNFLVRDSLRRLLQASVISYKFL
jgi:hypothetical protein